MVAARKAVQNMDAYRPPTEGREDKLRFDFNENTLGCSPKVNEALVRALTDRNLSAYPEYSIFREKLARYAGLAPEQVTISNGTDGIIKLVMDTFVEKGDEVIIPVPTYTMFKFYAQLADAKITEVLYEKDLTFPARAVLDSIRPGVRLVVLVNPNSPTGTTISDEDIEAAVKKAKENGALVLVDEAYFQFYGKSSRALIGRYENVIVIQTFSKAFGLAGLRLGFAMSDAANIAAMDKDNSPYGVSTLAIVGANAALDDLEFVEQYAAEVRKNRPEMAGRLVALGLKVYPSSANFLLVNFGSKEKCKLVCDTLKARGILIRNRSSDPLLEGCARMNVGTGEQNRRLLDELGKILPDTGGRAQTGQALLFDMDGVLVDVSQSYRKVIARTAEYFTGKGMSAQDVQDIKQAGGYNNDWDATEALIVKMGGKAEKKAIIDKFQEYYLGKDGVSGLIKNEKWMLGRKNLEALAKRYALGIVTGRPRAEAEYALKASQCADLFSVVVAMEDCPAGKSKPDPYGIRLALEKLGCAGRAYVGDSGDDMKAAKAAGLMAIGIPPAGMANGADAKAISAVREKLVSCGADKMIETLDGLEQALGPSD
ncbi:Aromatic-amino-acid aminotransferase 2 [uncultured archaeon]|nr:Aromatic-amino-acid aminotransferase 2 [uncultured archaeon]